MSSIYRLEFDYNGERPEKAPESYRLSRFVKASSFGDAEAKALVHIEKSGMDIHLDEIALQGKLVEVDG